MLTLFAQIRRWGSKTACKAILCDASQECFGYFEIIDEVLRHQDVDNMSLDPHTPQQCIAASDQPTLRRSLRVRLHSRTDQRCEADSSVQQHSKAPAESADRSSNALEEAAESTAGRSNECGAFHSTKAREAEPHADLWPALMMTCLPADKTLSGLPEHPKAASSQPFSDEKGRTRQMHRTEAVRRRLHRLEQGFCAAIANSAAPLYR